MSQNELNIDCNFLHYQIKKAIKYQDKLSLRKVRKAYMHKMVFGGVLYVQKKSSFVKEPAYFPPLLTSPYDKHLRAGTRSVRGTSSCRRAQLISLGFPIALGLCGLTSTPWLGLNYTTGCCIFSMKDNSLRQLLLSATSLQLN